MKIKCLSLVLALPMLLWQCGGEATTPVAGDCDLNQPVAGDWVRVWQPADPDNLNPFTHTHAQAGYINENIYQGLFSPDPVSLQPLPVLAAKPLEISPDGLIFTCEVRPEAKWADGSPVTGHDFAFTMKAIFNPECNSAPYRGAYDFIQDVVVDSANPRRFQVVAKFPFFRAEAIVSYIEFMPRYLLDPNNYLGPYTVAQMNTEVGSKEETALRNMPGIREFATLFNSPEYGRDPKFISGSGPYALESWTPNQQIVVVRKTGWWGDELAKTNPQFGAWPSKIIFKTIPDRSTAFTSMKGEEIDVMRDILPKDFAEATKTDPASLKYNLFTPDAYNFTCIMINNRPNQSRAKALGELNVRKALAHLVDVKGLIDNVYYGYGKPAVSPVSPLRGPIEFNDTLKMVPFDQAKATALLSAAGWTDTDGDHVLDKMIGGKKEKLEFEFLVSDGSTTGQAVALHFKENCQKAGIVINIKAMQFSLITEKTGKHDFDLAGLNMVSGHLPTDLYQYWHSDSYINGGSNSMGFVNAEADALIEQIRREPDANKRKPMYWRVQEIIAEQQPVIYMLVPQERVAINKRFATAKANSVRPNYQALSFWACPSVQKFK